MNKEYRKQQREHQRQEALAIAYGNAPESARLKALEILRDLDKQDKIEALIDEVKENIEKCKADEPQQMREPNPQAKKQIEEYLCSGAGVKPDELAEALHKMTKLKAAAYLYGLWKNPKRVRSVYDKGKQKQLVEFTPWVRLWNEAYALDLHYKPNQIIKHLKTKEE